MTAGGRARGDGRRHVVMCTGISSYNVLSYLSTDLARAFVRNGWTAEVLDLTRLATPTELRRIVMEERTAFFCGYSGYGSNIAGADGRPAYDALDVPYIGLMLDSPCYYPARHETPSARTIFLHGDDGHHDVSLAISPAGSHRGLFRLAVAPWTGEVSPLSRRDETVLFASKGGDPLRYEAMLREVLDAGSLRLVLGIAETLQSSMTPQRAWDVAIMAAPRAVHDARWHTIVAHADHLARIRRATAVARALLPLPVTFVGGEWSHLESPGHRATFLPGEQLPDVRRRMASTAFVLNVQPGTTDSVHDRFLLGLHAGAAVISDSNRFIDTQVGREQFVCWNGDPRTIADLVADALRHAHAPELQERATRGLHRARERFGLDTLVAHLGAVIDAHHAGHPLPHPDSPPAAADRAA